MEHFSEFLRGDAHDHRQDPVRSAHGLPAMDYFHADRRGDHRVRTLSCAEQYRSMAFAQLTYRESLRDIETILGPRIETLSHGLPPAGPALDAGRCQRKARLAIHAALAQRLITQARTLYVDEELGLDLTNTVYALDSTTIALCLSVFWAHFRTTKAAVKMRTLLDLRGNGRVLSTSRMASCTTHALDMLLPEAGAIYAVAWLRRLCPPLCVGRGLLRHAVEPMLIASIRRRRIARPASFRPDHLPDGFYTRHGRGELLRRQGPRVRQDAGLHHQQLLASGRHHLRALRRWRWNLLQVGQHLRICSSTARRRTR